jgi:hypothetical protein
MPTTTCIRKAGLRKKPSGFGSGTGPKRDPFDSIHAASQLDSVDLGPCYNADGPWGRGLITLELSPDGTVVPTAIDPAFRHSAVGECIDTMFRAVHLAPFSGEAMKASGVFNVEPLPANYWSSLLRE